LAFLPSPQAKARHQTTPPSFLQPPPDSNPQYFPKGIFGDSSDSGDFKERWYSSYLRVMAEPSLSDVTKFNSPSAYRFLWLRTFHHPIAIRLTIRLDGTGSIIGKTTSGKGGYEPGILSQNSSLEVSKPQTQQFLNLLQNMGFWNLPTERTVNGLDGAMWILERVQAANYHVLNRWSPKSDDYSRACLYLLELSKISVPAGEIY
jgi:hypothetical protein